MADNQEQSTPADAAQASVSESAQDKTGGKGDDGKVFTQAELERIVGKRLASERAKYADYDALKEKAAKLDEIEQAQKSELEREREARAAAEKRAAEAELKALRSEVARKKGVPASSLTGTTEEELNAAADELLAWRDQSKPAPTPKRAPRGEGLKSGATGAGNPNPDPKVAAAEALRRLRRLD